MIMIRNIPQYYCFYFVFLITFVIFDQIITLGFFQKYKKSYQPPKLLKSSVYTEKEVLLSQTISLLK